MFLISVMLTPSSSNISKDQSSKNFMQNILVCILGYIGQNKVEILTITFLIFLRKIVLLQCYRSMDYKYHLTLTYIHKRPYILLTC